MEPEAEHRINEILEAWLDQRREGRAPPTEEVIRAHPEFAEELRLRLEALQVLDHLLEERKPSPEVPERVGGYRILRELGRGSMGIVYEAEQPDLDRRVALKILSPAIANDPEAVARFYREAQAAGRLDHPNVVAIHEIAQDRAHLFYTMELVRGRSLLGWLELQRAHPGETASYLPAGETDWLQWLARTFAAVARALAAAHDHDVIHRDVKPSNILIAADGTPKIMDFGLARLGGGAETLTQPGTVLGTLQYMSPEQARAAREQIDARTDIYSLGATLYEALTLKAPFRGDDAVQIISRIITTEPTRPRRVQPAVPRDLETITLKAMAKEPEQRYANALALADDLERFLREESIQARRPGVVRRARSWSRRRPALAAAAWAGLAVLAMLVWVVARPAVSPTLARLTEAGVLPVPDLAGLLPAGATAEKTMAFVVPDRGFGTLVVATVAGEYGGRFLDVFACGVGGEVLWNGREAWDEYENTFGVSTSTFTMLRSFVARTGDDRTEVAVVVTRRGGLFRFTVFDPLTGESLHNWDHDGEWISAHSLDQCTITTLPDETEGTPRRLLVAGGPDGNREARQPLLWLRELDGTLIQECRLPTVGGMLRYPGGAVTDIRTDWTPGAPRVTVSTDEDVHFTFEVRDRRLVAESAEVGFGDTLRRTAYDQAQGKEGAWKDRVEASGGLAGLTAELKTKIVVREGPD
ncbi:MAG: serine/threonine-protein kinase [Planctomycetota bacterium]|jgi:hypothetical protein